jgi:glycosyltransferase involved in cell wall biosynthesis
MNPFLSIITININNKEGLIKTIDSVVNQEFDDYEYIVIDGGSTDGSFEIIKLYEQNIHFWISEPDKGIYHAMNKGIRTAKGEYLLFLNSGDWLVENILVQIGAYHLTEEIVYFNSFLAYEGNKIEKLIYPDELSMRYFFKSTIGHQSTLIKRELFNRFGIYNEQLKIYGDFDFWLRTLIAGNCCYIHIPLFLSYYEMNGISAKPDINSQNEHRMIIEKYLSKRIICDYAYYSNLLKDIEIYLFFKNSIFNVIIVFIYKIIKNIKKLFKG